MGRKIPEWSEKTAAIISLSGDRLRVKKRYIAAHAVDKKQKTPFSLAPHPDPSQQPHS